MPVPSMSFLSLLLLVVLLFSFTFPSLQDLAADRAALLSLRSSLGGRTFLWNISHPTPCNWPGVKCQDGRVTVLRLPGVSLSGSISLGIFGNLTRLRTLSLRLNSLYGSLPSDLAACANLRNLYLQGNKFSGDIPAVLFDLRGLVRLNLAGNNFSGDIPPALNNLTRLKTLYLENNQLSGSIPDLYLPLEQFNVSNNLLNGSIPKKLQTFGSDSFQNTSLCGKPLDSCPTEGTVPSQPTSGGSRPGNIEKTTKKKKNKLSGGAIAGIAIGCVVGFALIVLIVMVLCRKKGNERSRAVDIASLKRQEVELPGEKVAGEVENENYGNGYSVAAAAAAAMTGNARGGEVNNGSGAKKLVFFGNATRVFDLEDLLRASAEVLGKGTFGTAYKAVLDAATVVTVKRLKDVTMMEKEFREKIEGVGAMDHGNLVPLRAYYYSRDEKLLVHDYMPMGSLSALLHGNKGALEWETRSRIALGAARGIEYLHSQGSGVSHGNVKSSNILLTKSYEARVSDFGLAQLVGPSSTPNRATGYRAPEVTDPRRVSQKADVYSYGVMLLELMTGKAPMHALLNEEGVDLPRWVQSVVKEGWRNEVLDAELVRQEAEEKEMEMVELLQLGVECAAQHPDKRPSMWEVVRRIEELRSPSTGDVVGAAEDD